MIETKRPARFEREADDVRMIDIPDLLADLKATRRENARMRTALKLVADMDCGDVVDPCGDCRFLDGGIPICPIINARQLLAELEGK